MKARTVFVVARPTTWLAAGLWVFILGISIAIVAMKANGWQGAGNTSDTSGVALFVALFAFATMGALVAARVPHNPMGWLFLAIPFGGAVAGITENLAFQGLVHDPGSVPAATAFAWVYSWTWYPLIGLLGFVLLLYPTGTVPGLRWRVVGWALGLALAVMTLGCMFYAGPLDKDRRLPDNPLGIGWLKGVFDRNDRFATISMAGLVINKALVYGASSALLAGAYVGLVIASEAVFAPVAGGSSVAVALSTLVVAALFMPVRARVQRFVDRRFYRRKVSAEETLARFGARLRREGDLDTLLAELNGAVREALQPAEVWLWLRAEEPRT
jgi:hypothetical protein